MTPMKLDKFCLVGAIAALLALIFPLAGIDPDTGKQVAFVGDIPGLAIAMALCVIAGAAFTWLGVRTVISGAVILAVAVFGCSQAIATLYDYGVAGYAGTGFWLFIISLWAFVWEVVVSGFGVPQVLLPPPSMIGVRFVTSTDIMAADFYQTFVKAVLSGYVLGCGSAFVMAIAVDRVPFLKRGLLPLGNMVSALPIIGVAPIMVMWFGFDWQSKAAVIVIMTFFPMLVNTVTGLNAAGKLERDLMATYASGYWSTLFRLRLPAAMPFVFNALKINSTLALIGAIVAEFFGTPIVGMGFRISTEVGRMNIDMVWAEIALAALAGTAFYGAVAYIERKATSWHPSFRVRRH